jgi:spore germination protein GerM
MSRRAAGLILAAALVLVLGTVGWWFWHGGRAGACGARRGLAPAAAGGAAGERRPFDLYFPAAGGGLRAERREIEVSDDPRDRIQRIVTALLGGPDKSATQLVRPFPPEVKLGSVQLSADGVAYLDLRWSDREDPPESGSTEELQRVYSLVDSVSLNVPEANRVVLLWNGTQRITFSGHLDTSRPLVPDRTLLSP